jgi:DNA-binding CsgD family transcriptional regulator
MNDTAWVLLPADAVPDEWARRGRPFVLLRMLPGEARRLLGGAPARPELDAVDERLVALVAAGRSAAETGRLLGYSRRTVERRLARLRAKVGVATTAELVAHLAAAGFG